MQPGIRHIIFLLTLCVACCPRLFAQLTIEPIKWEEKGITINLKDDLRHPQFSWPATAVHYRIDFGPAGIGQNELNLTDEVSGKPVPFQLIERRITASKITEATLVFLSDLPSGSNKKFRLTVGKNKAIALNEDAIKVEKSSDVCLLSNGKIKIEIPLPGSTKLSAPVKRFGNSEKWLGYGEMPDSLQPLTMSVTELTAGPVQAGYRISYEFKGNKKYTLRLNLTAGMEFLEVEEEMSGFKLREAKFWRLVWNGLALDKRYASTRAEKIDNKQKGYTNINWEPMEGLTVTTASEKHPQLASDQQNSKDGRLPFRIAPYDNWMTWWRLPTAAFWSEKENTTIGLFIKDIEKWDDGLYALWGSKQNLNIYFHWKNNVLDYTFPLVNGTRSTALAAYRHDKDVDLVNKANTSLAYIDDLRRWYGWINLDKVKNWTLTYDAPETGYPRYFLPQNSGPALTSSSLENSLFNNLKTIATGTERLNGPNPVGSRVYHNTITPAFDLNAGKMPAEQYQKLRAWFLFTSYLYMDETLMPMRTLLAGHPNFLSDIKAVPGLAAFLFPKHPEAAKMADHYEKSIHLNFNYHIRPDVSAWESRGGRWTENLATYTWAALTPNIRTNYLLSRHFDGKNRILQPGVDRYGDWLLNAISSPLSAKSNRRVYPPQGAHAHAYGEGPPNALRLLGQELMHYKPLLGEGILWLTTPEDNPFESTKENSKVWGEMVKGEWENNKGTNPHLISQKYTGYGHVLRSAFGTKEEMYVNLQQIDEGPNYRWGRAGMGGNGVIYYYAQGKRYSHNGAEDAGDGPFGDTERITNFGVKKDGGYRAIGPYRSVGRNDLTEPLYDFGFAQFASIKGNNEIAGDYRSRSVLQSNADYIVVYDDVTNPQAEGRFSWFVGIEDDFPEIHQLSPGAPARDAGIKSSRSNYHKDPEVMPTKGRYYDGKGSFLTIVSHKPEIRVTKAPFGAVVEKTNGTDLVFRDSKAIQYHKDDISFFGTAGIVEKNGNDYAAALFSGSAIGIPGIKIELAQTNKAGVSMQTTLAGFTGQFQSRQAEQITLTTTKPKLTFYLDGVAVAVKSIDPATIQLTIPAGKHTWQWTDKGVIPGGTEITSAVVKSKEVALSWKAVAGASAYQLQLSKDGGNSWVNVKDNISESTTVLGGLVNGTKVHVRVVPKGQGGVGKASNEYPVYVSEKAPPAPQGLLLDLNGEQTEVSWGTVLGAGQYQLYRRETGPFVRSVFTKIYSGSNTAFMDRKPSKGSVYEYKVSAVNGNGEGNTSNVVDTDPASILNWEPKGAEGFRRDTEDHENGFVEFDPLTEDKKPILSYPVNN